MHSLITGETVRPPHDAEVTNHVDDQAQRQFIFPVHLLARSWVRLLYGGRDIVKDAARIVGIEPSDSIVDLGCGDGSFLSRAAVEYGVKAPMLGLELSGDTVRVARDKIAKAREGGLPNVQIVQANIQQTLPLRRNSANIVSLINVIYHVGDPEKVADKINSIVQPGGRVLVVTKDPGDLAKAWEWVSLAPQYFAEKYPNKYPNMQAPVPFYENCNLERTLEIFDGRFERQYPADPNSTDYLKESITPLRIAGDHAWTDYLYVLLSICEELNPRPLSTECREFIRDVLQPKFEAELEEKGYVEDEARQYVMVYKKPSNQYFNLLRALRLNNNHPYHTRPERIQMALREKTSQVASGIGKLITQASSRSGA